MHGAEAISRYGGDSRGGSRLAKAGSLQHPSAPPPQPLALASESPCLLSGHQPLGTGCTGPSSPREWPMWEAGAGGSGRRPRGACGTRAHWAVLLFQATRIRVSSRKQNGEKPQEVLTGRVSSQEQASWYMSSTWHVLRAGASGIVQPGALVGDQLPGHVPLTPV